MALSVVIPAYNEADGILAIVERVLAIRPALAASGIGELELIVVDDGSADRTAEVATREGVRVIRHEVNRGYGAALKTGFAAAKGELLGFLDADGTYPPEHFPELAKEALKESELVVGSRRSGAQSEMPLVRRVGNLLWSFLVSWACRHPVQDPASGMRVFRREVLEKLYPLPDGLNFTPVMSTRAVHESVKLLEIPIPYKERVGRSKLSVVSDGMRFLSSILVTALSYNPRRVLAPLAIAFIAMSGLLGLAAIWMWIPGATREVAHAAWLFTVLFPFVAGVIVLGLGATLSQVVSTFRRADRGPARGHVSWIGGACTLLGIAVCAAVVAKNGHSGAIDQPWLYLLAGTMIALLGLALMALGAIVRVAGLWGRREAMRRADMESR